MNETKERMEKDGLREGSLVTLVLKPGAKLDNSGASTVPTFRLSNEKQDRQVIATGYAVQIPQNLLGLIPVWDKKNKKHPELFLIGGVNYGWDTIESYKIEN